MEITGIEANLLLTALDKMLPVDAFGHQFACAHGYTRKECQSLRDRLFAAHEHKPEDGPLHD